MTQEEIVVHLVRVAIEGKKEDVAMLGRRYARRMLDRIAAKKLLQLLVDKGYGPKIFRED